MPNLLSITDSDANCLPDLELRSPIEKKKPNLKNKFVRRKKEEFTIKSFKEPTCLSKNRNILFACLNLILCLAILIVAVFYLQFYEEFRVLKSELFPSAILINRELEDWGNSVVFNEKEQDRWNLNSAADVSKLRRIMHEQTIKIEQLVKTNVELWAAASVERFDFSVY
uniref:Uncharacterized protein n=1 Tax=Romanomermis culicivorax TaxID=13658 RepID=A0A915KS45_ROMCU